MTDIRFFFFFFLSHGKILFLFTAFTVEVHYNKYKMCGGNLPF